MVKTDVISQDLLFNTVLTTEKKKVLKETTGVLFPPMK